MNTEICARKYPEVPWAPGDVPPVGSMVSFTGKGFHVAVSLGKTTPDGKAMVASIALATPNDNIHTQITTIEDLQLSYPNDVITYGTPPRLNSGEDEAAKGDGAEGALPLWATLLIGLGAATVVTAAAAAGVYHCRRGRTDGHEAANTPISLVTLPGGGRDVINNQTGEPVLPQIEQTPMGRDFLST